MKKIEEIEYLILQSDFQEALCEIKQYIDNNICNCIVYNMQAICYFYLNELELSEESLIKSFQLDGFSADNYNLLGMIFEKKEMLENAYLSYIQAYSIASNQEDKTAVLDNIQEIEQKIHNKKMLEIIIYNADEIEKIIETFDSIRKTVKHCEYVISVLVSSKAIEEKARSKYKENVMLIVCEKENVLGYVAERMKTNIEKKDMCFIESGTIVYENTLFNLHLALCENNNVGITIGVNNNFINVEARNIPGDIISKKINIYSKNAHKLNIKNISNVMMIRSDNLNLQIQENLNSVSMCLLNYMIDSLKNRRYILRCEDSFSTYNGNDEVWSREDYKLINENIGFDLRYSTNPNMYIVNIIVQDNRKELNVLEVGCACGGTLVAMHNEKPDTKLYGIEINKNASDVAASYIDIRAENIESNEMNYEEQFFDYIILGDVLEHLSAPDKVLTNLRKYLKDNGSIIASIPNVMHISVIRDMLVGYWNYEDSGLLDRTHIHFFTYNNAKIMFEQLGYTFECKDTSKVRITEEEKKIIDFLQRIRGVAPREQFEAYQYIIKATKSTNV